MRTHRFTVVVMAWLISGCAPSNENPERVSEPASPALTASAAAVPDVALEVENVARFKAQEPSAAERSQIIAMAENMKTKDGSTVGKILRNVERLKAKQFKVVNGFDLNYNSEGSLSGVSVCYWIGEKREDGDEFCDLAYRLSKDRTQLERETGGNSQADLEDQTLTALENGEESFLRYIDLRYRTRDTTVTIEDGAEIQAVLASIPAVSVNFGRMTLAERLASLGVYVQRYSSGHLSLDEVALSDGMYKIGDELFDFQTSELPTRVTDACATFSTFSFIKRGRSWLPQSRAANFYAFGICGAPG